MHLRVGLDITPLLNKVPRGIGNYIYELTFHMENVDFRYFYKISRLKYLKRLKRLPKFSLPFFEVAGKTFFPRNFHIFHGTDNYVPQKGKFPRILTVHDVYPLIRSPEGKVAKKIRKAINREPERIIFISNFAKKEFLKFFPHYSGPTHVVYHGVSDFWKPADNHTLKKHLGRLGVIQPYIFYAGDTDGRKNVENLIIAVSLIKDVTLVMAGGSLKIHQLELIRQMGVEKRVLHVGYVTREELRSLYTGASLFVFPSRYEGFGLPLLEAMKCGTPVVASNIEIFKEIADDAFFPVDPESPESIKHGIEAVMKNIELRKNLVGRGKEVSSRFTWSMTARRTLEVYNLALYGKAK